MTAVSAQLRLALVENLSRRGLVRTPAVREAFLRVPRERFVPEVAEQRGLEAVYKDEALVTKLDQSVAVSSSSQPAIMAEMLERLQVSRGLRVLEIGTGTGYNAALLADMAGGVVTLDVDAELAETARRRLAAGAHEAEVVVGDGIAGWPAGAPYDRIVVTATPPYISTTWRDQLRQGGLLEVPIQLGHDHAVAHLVVTFQRAGDELVSTAIVSGGFMGFRGPDGRRPDYPQPRLGWHDSTGRGYAGAGLYGPGLTRLGAAARRRLLTALVAGPHRSSLGRGADVELLLWLVCTAPHRRLVAMTTTDGHRLGLVDERGGLAVLHYSWSQVERIGVAGAERYGEPAAADCALRGLVERWRRRGRPKLADFEVRVAFGRPPRGATWRLPSGGEARIGVSVRPRSG